MLVFSPLVMSTVAVLGLPFMFKSIKDAPLPPPAIATLILSILSEKEASIGLLIFIMSLLNTISF